MAQGEVRAGAGAASACHVGYIAIERRNSRGANSKWYCRARERWRIADHANAKVVALWQTKKINRVSIKWEREPSPQQISRQKGKKESWTPRADGGQKGIFSVRQKRRLGHTEHACLCRERGKTK